MGAPFAAADLVGDQRVARRRVGNAQQRLRQAHQRDALLAGERVFAHQALHQPGAGRSRKVVDQPPRHRPRLLGDRRRQLGGGDQRRHDFGLGGAIERVDRGAPAVVADELGGEGGKRTGTAAVFNEGAVGGHRRFSSEDGKDSVFLHAIDRPLKGRSDAAGHSAAVANRPRRNDIASIGALLRCCTATSLLEKSYGFLPLNLGWR